MNDRFASVFEEVDFRLFESRALRARGPQFLIVQYGEQRSSRKEVAVLLVHQTHTFLVRMSTAQKGVFDYLAWCRLSQTASQIELGMRTRSSRMPNGRNGGPNRASIKVFIQRIRAAMELAFREARIVVDARDVLVSEQTTGTEVTYQLRALVDHIDF